VFPRFNRTQLTRIKLVFRHTTRRVRLLGSCVPTTRWHRDASRFANSVIGTNLVSLNPRHAVGKKPAELDVSFARYARLFFTTFPNPAPKPEVLNRLASDPGNNPTIRGQPKAGPSASPDDTAKYYYFTIDDQLLYLSFFQDWGPLNLAMVYKACILIHELLEVRGHICHALASCIYTCSLTMQYQDKDLANYKLVLYSSDDPRRKANAALLVALFVVCFILNNLRLL